MVFIHAVCISFEQGSLMAPDRGLLQSSLGGRSRWALTKRASY